MSAQYDLYLFEHRKNVYDAFKDLKKYIPEVINDGVNYEWQIGLAHDASKTNKDEYMAYDKYFYGDNVSFADKEAFNNAWLIHIHRNPHHWQYWVLVNDDPEEGKVAVEMPYNYIIEMICDWMSFSIAKDDPMELFSFYDSHKDYITLHKNTRKTVEYILDKLKNHYDQLIGVKNGEN